VVYLPFLFLYDKDIITNGMFKSPEIQSGDKARKRDDFFGRDQCSVICIPESDKEIESIDRLVSELRARLYKR
jgi:hypothetical protein